MLAVQGDAHGISNDELAQRDTSSCRLTDSLRIGLKLMIKAPPFNTPDEGKDQQEDRRSGFTHCVEAQGDEGQREVGDCNIQPCAHTIGHHCTNTTIVRSMGTFEQ